MNPRKVALFSIGPLGASLLGLISLPVVTWFFSQDDVGRMAMFQVTLSFGSLLLSLGLDQAYVREFHESYNQPALLKSVVAPGLSLLTAVILIVLSMGTLPAKWVFGVPNISLTVLLATAVLATFVSRFLSLVLRMNERGLAFSSSQLLAKVLLLAIVGGYAVTGTSNSLTALVFANTAAITITCVAFAWYTRREWRKSLAAEIDYAHLKRMLRFGLPLIPGGLAFWGLTATDKIFLRVFSTYDELGIYSVAVSFAAAGTILQSVFSTVWAPTVYKWASRGDDLDKAQNVTRYVLLCVITIFSLAGLFSWVVMYVLPPAYEGVQWVLLSCLGYPLLYTLSETTVVGIGISRRSSFAMVAAALAFGVNLLGNWLLVPIFGADGAASATCVAFLVFFVLRTEFSCYLWKPIDRKLLYIYTILVVTGAVIDTLCGDKVGSLIHGFWGITLLSTLAAFRKEFSELRVFLRYAGRKAILI